MITPTLDQKHTDLIAELAILNNKLSLFLNGSDTQTITTGSGTVKSLSGIAKDLKSFKYVQRVIDHRLYSDMISSDSVNIDMGMLVRVWGDTDIINGMYRKDNQTVYTKIIYSDVYDLKEYMPNPWNYRSISKTAAEFIRDLDILTLSMPNMVGKTFDEVIQGSIKSTTSDIGVRGSYAAEFKIHIATDNNQAMSLVKIANPTAIALDDITIIATDGGLLSTSSLFSIYNVPAIYVNVVSTITEHVFTVSVRATANAGVAIPAQLELNLYRIDPSKYTII
jgi:hypothetical protein